MILYLLGVATGVVLAYKYVSYILEYGIDKY